MWRRCAVRSFDWKMQKNNNSNITLAVFRNEQAKKVNGNMMTQYDLPKQNSKRTKR